VNHHSARAPASEVSSVISASAADCYVTLAAVQHPAALIDASITNFTSFPSHRSASQHPPIQRHLHSHHLLLQLLYDNNYCT